MENEMLKFYMSGCDLNIEDEILRYWRNCERKKENWVSLSIEGAGFVSCYVEHRGKRGHLVVFAEGFPPLHVPLNHHVRFGCLDGIEQRLIALDDDCVGLLLRPRDGCTVRLAEAKVDYWLEDDDAAEMLAQPESGPWSLEACFELKLGFTQAK